MTYKIIVKHKRQKLVQQVGGVRELHKALGEYHKKGLVIDEVRRVGGWRRLFNLKNGATISLN